MWQAWFPVHVLTFSNFRTSAKLVQNTQSTQNPLNPCAGGENASQANHDKNAGQANVALVPPGLAGCFHYASRTMPSDAEHGARITSTPENMFRNLLPKVSQNT